ncbi:hypothetical protein IFM89_006232 [Coptis chinensis]|uniref:Uncharacterized protein n=1 Tax=Coptis chinensis TaxID=261450 RepID=A0A835H9U1_9MAGN|nr:hypothetical protein IFM89_006232 [Coptis chinensis]
MSMKQHRKCGSFDFPPESRKFEIVEPMHEMWKEYVLKQIKNPGTYFKQISNTAMYDLKLCIVLVPFYCWLLNDDIVVEALSGNAKLWCILASSGTLTGNRKSGRQEIINPDSRKFL